jgi:hypothetical protein
LFLYHEHDTDIVGFEVLTKVVMKCTIFWYTIPCSPLKVNRRFRGTCRLHGCACYILHTRLFGFFLDPENASFMLLRNVGQFLADSMALYPKDRNNHDTDCLFPWHFLRLQLLSSLHSQNSITFGVTVWNCISLRRTNKESNSRTKKTKAKVCTPLRMRHEERRKPGWQALFIVFEHNAGILNNTTDNYFYTLTIYLILTIFHVFFMSLNSQRNW